MTTLILKYNLNLEDLITFNEDYLRHSESFQKNLHKQQLVYLGGFLLAGFLFVLLGFQNSPDSSIDLLTSTIVLLLCTTPGILIFALLPRLTYKSVHSRAKQALAQGKNVTLIGNQELRLNSNAITVHNNFHESRYSWAAIEKIISTTDYIYIFYSAVNAIIIPKHTIVQGDWQKVENLVRAKLNAA